MPALYSHAFEVYIILPLCLIIHQGFSVTAWVKEDSEKTCTDRFRRAVAGPVRISMFKGNRSLFDTEQ